MLVWRAVGYTISHKHLPQHWLIPFSQLSGGCRIFRASLGLRGTCTRINLPHEPEAPFRQENLGNAAILPVNQHLAPWSSFAPSYASVHQSCASESWILKQSCEVKRKELSWTLRKASASTNMHSCRSQTRPSCFLEFLQTKDRANMIREITFWVHRKHVLTKTNAAKGRLVLLDMRGMANCKTVNLLPNLSKQIFVLGHSLSCVKATKCN